MIGFIGTSLQLQSIIRAHTLNSFLTTSVWLISIRNLSLLESASESELHYDLGFTANQFVLAPSPLRLTARIVFSQLNTCVHSPYITSSLMRGRVCHLQLLLVLASAFILGSESLGIRDHILLSQIRDFPFRRLRRRAGLWWRHYTPPPHGIPLEWQSQSYVTTDGRSTSLSWHKALI
jgi:hypothetical protein